MIVNELISKTLSEMGEPEDGTGFWTRTDALAALSYIQREINLECENLMVTSAAIDIPVSTEEVAVNPSGNLIRVFSAYRVYGGEQREIAVYEEAQLINYDLAWKTRTAELIRGIVTDIAAEGYVRLYPIPDNGNNDLIVRYIKAADELSTELTESGDAANQLTTWILKGISASNTNNYTLYWDLTNSVSTRTVKLYKAATKLAADLVAQGSRTGDGLITLSEQNNSGMTGSVTVTYSVDDTDAANTLVLKTMETPAMDVPVIEHGIKALLYGIDRDGKNEGKAAFYGNLYQSGTAAIKKRMRIKRSGTYRTLIQRDTVSYLRTRPLYPWEV